MSESPRTAAILRSLPGCGRRPRNGKIARLPQDTRELINQMLDDGLPYARILDKLRNSPLPTLPYPISEMNLSNWYRGGFRDWRRHRDQEKFLKNAAPLPFDQPEPNNLATPNPPLANLQPVATTPVPLAAPLRLLKARLAQTAPQSHLLKPTTPSSRPLQSLPPR
jgi:hypothetical protein